MRGLLAIVFLFPFVLLLVGCRGNRNASPPIAYVVRPTITATVPSSSMEPTLHCAEPGLGCEAKVADRLLVRPVALRLLKQGDIILFQTPQLGVVRCGAAGSQVKRLIGLPGETVYEDGEGFLSVASPGSKSRRRLDEPYVQAAIRAEDTANFNHHWVVAKGRYFFVGDDRIHSCDSRIWGGVTGPGIIGLVTKVIRTR